MHKISGNYDIIGDIHGYASTLIQLLEELGYEKNRAGVFYHKERKIIFLGDFIDRGKEESSVINIVKPMIENGYALAVMGNHEFNAISYHTKHPITNKPLREHNERNQKTHQAFLDEYPVGDPKTLDVINWFKTLPLFIELDDFRVIHACWDDTTLAQIKPKLNIDNTMTESLYIKTNKKGSDEYKAIEILLKGIELSLPEGLSFKDKDGNVRTEIRVKWWIDNVKTYRDYAQVSDDQLQNIPDIPLQAKDINPAYSEQSNPIFFGHYWFNGVPQILKKNIACLDYSVAKNGKLVCYRWNKGDSTLSNKQFSHVENNKRS